MNKQAKLTGAWKPPKDGNLCAPLLTRYPLRKHSTGPVLETLSDRRDLKWVPCQAECVFPSVSVQPTREPSDRLLLRGFPAISVHSVCPGGFAKGEAETLVVRGFVEGEGVSLKDEEEDQDFFV